MKQYIKTIDKDLLLEDLENIKEDITLDEYQFVKSFANNEQNFDVDDCCYLDMWDLDIMHRLNVLELESLNFAAVLPDCGCDLPEVDFLSAFWETLSKNIMDFILPFNSEHTPDSFDNDTSAFIEEYKTLYKVDVSSMRSDIESVFRGLHNQLNIKCFDATEVNVYCRTDILDYEDYTLF